MSERVQIFIDGGNFYHLVLKKLGLQELDFDFNSFALFLANDRREFTSFGKRYYIGTVREKEGDIRSKEAMSRQTKLFSDLKKSSWEIKTSKLRTRTEEIYIDSRIDNYKAIRKAGFEVIKVERIREKGIDVKIATDLIVGAVDNQYDTAIVVSSDSDLVPAIDWIRRRYKKKIEYVGFSIEDPKNKQPTKPLFSMISHTDIQRTLTQTDIEQFRKVSRSA